jgi:hypothetical protein
MQDRGLEEGGPSTEHERAKQVVSREAAREKSLLSAPDEQANSGAVIKNEGGLFDEGIEENELANREAASEGGQLWSSRPATKLTSGREVVSGKIQESVLQNPPESDREIESRIRYIVAAIHTSDHVIRDIRPHQT